MPFETVATGIAPSSAPVSDANRAGNHVWLVAIAEDPATGQRAWSEHVASVWGRQSATADAEPAPYFDAAPWEPDES